MTFTIGFIGLGNMGAPIAANLAKGAQSVIAFDVRTEALASAREQGMTTAQSVREVADQTDTLFVSLPTPQIVEQVVLGAGGIIEGSAVRRVIDLSTSGPRMARRLSEPLAKKGIALLEAPVSGGVGGARAATLAIMTSGPEETYREVAPLLQTIGKPFFVGAGAGLAQTMKLVNNMVSGAALAITAEAMAMGAKAGIDPGIMIAVLNAGSGRNTATLDKFPRAVLTGSYDYGFATELMLKDSSLFMDEAEALGLSLPTSQAVRQLWIETLSELGPCDFTAIARLMEQRANVSFRAA